MRRASICAVVGLLVTQGCASAKPRASGPIVVTPDDARRAAEERAEEDAEEDAENSGDAATVDLSDGGTRSGALEYSLGGVTAAVSAALIAFGGVQLSRAVNLRAFCAENGQSTECDALIGNPPVNYFVSGGLSLGFSALIAVASGMLFRRAVRTQRAYRAWHSEQVALRPWGGARSGGLSLTLRF